MNIKKNTVASRGLLFKLDLLNRTFVAFLQCVGVPLAVNGAHRVLDEAGFACLWVDVFSPLACLRHDSLIGSY